MFTPIREKGAKRSPRFAIERGENVGYHWQNFIECCRKRDKNTNSPMDLAFRTQTPLHMAMLGYKAGRTAKFDADKMSIIL